MKVARGLSVRVEYELKVKGGEVIESSKKSGPLTYVQGGGKMLPGFEKQIDGLEAGQEKRGVIAARDAFGTEESLPVSTIPTKEFPAAEKLEVGRIFQAKGPTGQPIAFKVVSVGAEQAEVRFLHPLVGKDIEYFVKVLGVEDPKHKHAPPPPPAEALGINLDEIEEVK